MGAAEKLTFEEDLSTSLFELVADLTTLRWPSPRYQQDPVGYFRDILGCDPWSAQVEVLESIRDNPRTAWKSGHRVSKSHTMGGASLWFYSSFEDARVVMSAPVARQVDDILWRQALMMMRDSGVCLECKKDPNWKQLPRPCEHSALIDGTAGSRAATGLRSKDFREIRGYTAKDVESITGTAGKNLFFAFDESTGIVEEIFEGLEGNRAGWAEDGEGTVRVALTGNPTKTVGEFYNAFNSKASFYNCITTSSEDTPNCKAGKQLIPGVATRDWVEEKKEMWGEDSALYKIRVKGEFAEKEDGKIFSVAVITEAEQRHETTVIDLADRLYIGIDPAGESGTGDEAAFATRRGPKMLDLLARLGLDEAGHVNQAMALIGDHGHPREKPVVVLDAEGAVGAKVAAEFQKFLYEHKRKPPFVLVLIRASQKAQRQPYIYERMREELTANFEAWIRKKEGAILEDAKLAAEMHMFEWEEQVDGRLKLVPRKRDLRKTKYLGRSPDRYDATVLSVWEPSEFKTGAPVVDDDDDDEDELAEGTFDPYAAADAWKR